MLYQITPSANNPDTMFVINGLEYDKFVYTIQYGSYEDNSGTPTDIKIAIVNKYTGRVIIPAVPYYEYSNGTTAFTSISDLITHLSETIGFISATAASVSLVIVKLLYALELRSDNYENEDGTIDILEPLYDNNLLRKASIILTPTAYSNGSINVVKPEYQVLPTELVTNGDFDTNSDWTRETGWIIGSGVASASSISGARIYQNILTVGKKYRATFELKSCSSGYVRVIIGGYSYAYQTTAISEHTVDFTAVDIQFGFLGGASFTGSIDNVSVKEIQEADFDFVRATTATRVNENGLIEEVAAGIPRIDYSSGVGQWLFEPSRKNDVTYSSDIDSLTKNNAPTITTNIFTAPDGTLSADGIQDTTGGTYKSVSKNSISVSANSTYTISIYIKKETSETGYGGVSFYFLGGTAKLSYIGFDAVNGTTGVLAGSTITPTIKVVDFNNDWWRLEATATDNGSNTSLNVYYHPYISSNLSNLTVGISSVRTIWGFQAEQGSYATSYIPTNGTTETRNADVANNSGNADLFNDSEGVLYVEISALTNDYDTSKSISISSGAYSNNIIIQYTSNINQIVFKTSPSYTTPIFQSYNVSDITENSKIAFKYTLNDCSFWHNGVKLGSITSFTPFSSGTLTELNFDRGEGGESFYGKTKELMYFPEALSDLDLETVTSWSSFELMVADLEYNLV